MAKINKTGKIVLITLMILVLCVALTGAILLIPRVGKAPDDYVWEGEQSFNLAKIESLNIAEDKDFKILQLSDTQLDFPFKSLKTLKKVIDTLIKENEPDLIVLTGDITAGVFTHFYINDIIDLFDSYKIPWAPVFGNHDRELNANLYYQSQQLYKSEYCLFSEGPNNIEGVGNYVVNIKNGDEVVYSLFMMDSNASREYIIDGKKSKQCDYIYPNQINWYTDNVNSIAKTSGKVVPSLAFFHIPLPEFLTAYELSQDGSGEAELLYGEKREGVGRPYENSGFFDKMLELGSTTHVFVGHDHINNFAVKYKGIVLAYGTKTGNFNTYDADMNGGTLITITRDGKATSENKFVAI